MEALTYSPPPPELKNFFNIILSENVSETMAAESGSTTTFVSILLGLLYALNIIISFLGNTMVIIAVATTHKLRTITNYLLMSLAVADLTVTVGDYPVSYNYNTLFSRLNRFNREI